jgi:tetratricopeptide (TPR) repeat protein
MRFPKVQSKAQLTLLRMLRRLAMGISLGMALTAACRSLGSEDEVSALREKIDRAERERAELCKILGAIHEESGDTDNAIRVYRMGFQVAPDDPFLCEKLKELCTKGERWKELVLVYESLIYANPGANGPYMKKLAECHLKVGQMAEAVMVIGEMLEEYGDTAADYRDAGQMLMTYELYDAAADILRGGIEKKPDRVGELYFMLGRSLAKAHKYSEAVEAYEKAIELCDSEREKRILTQELAELCEEGSVVEDILDRKMESVKALDERLADLYWQMACGEEERGNVPGATAFYRKIVSLTPGSDRAKAAATKVQQLSGE